MMASVITGNSVPHSTAKQLASRIRLLNMKLDSRERTLSSLRFALQEIQAIGGARPVEEIISCQRRRPGRRGGQGQVVDGGGEGQPGQRGRVP